ncbi:MAG TPA: SDR family oxidoreductase [Kofleriaceae bacterium]|nr:SDR family oxidoreductase [Kofleriaceae bacterium]
MTSQYDAVCRELQAAPQRWLVTGAAGFIGSALVEQLLRLGQAVVGLDSLVTGKRENLDDVRRAVGPAAARRFDFVEGDIRDLDACRRATRGAQLCLHQAALGSVPRSLEDPLSSHQSNVDGFIHVLLAAREAGVRRVVYASSSSVYGDNPALPKVEDQIGQPLSPYAATKRVDEIYAGVWQRAYGLELIGLRYFNVFGRRQDPDGQYAAVIPRWIARLAAGERCAIFGDGSQSRDFCYVDNAVQANLLAASTEERSATGHIYNVGVGGRTTLLELHALLRERVAARRPAAQGSEPDHTDTRAGDVPHSQASIDKARKLLHYEPTHDIASGLTETVTWFLDRLS